MLHHIYRVDRLFFMVFAAIGCVKATDPIFKFIPKTSLSNLKVTHITEFDIEMVVGSNAAARTVITVNGPFSDGSAGMTGVSMTATSKGSNVNGPDFTTISTSKTTTAQDGQYDVMYKNFTAISRTSTGVTTTLDNTLNLVASMKTVDKPGATSSDTLWVWCSAEVGDEYVWVSEEATSIYRETGDRPHLQYTLKYHTGFEIFFATMVKISGDVSHLGTSRINAYNVKLRINLPAYVKYREGTFNITGKYPNGSPKYITEENNNVLVLTFPKIGVAAQLSFQIFVEFDGGALRLKGGQAYDTYIPAHLSYCDNVACSPTGAIEYLEVNLTKSLRMREIRDKFLIKHVPSGRCISFSGTDDAPAKLKGACDEKYVYNNNAEIQHVTSSVCTRYTEGYFTLTSRACIYGQGFERSKIGTIKAIYAANVPCFAPMGSGEEGDQLHASSTCSTPNAKFKLIDDVPASSRLSMGQKVILATKNKYVFFCNRHKYLSRPSCFFKNGTDDSTIKALPADMVYVKAWDAVKSDLYGIGNSGKSYVKINLIWEPHKVYQLEDSLWSSIAEQAGIEKSTDVVQSSLKDFPEQQGSSSYAVSLKGLYQQDTSSKWNLFFNW
ncbi:uncharacterized protein LOC135692595 [Rhopilema esculentum]|uniref:uncharacterized protein LOC135692595 n=1 Tax=Rhopilema esculentum TaxID=499914 RepID=UPI0031DB3357